MCVTVAGLLHGYFARGVAGFHDVDAFGHVRDVHAAGVCGGVHQQAVGVVDLDVGRFVEHHAVAFKEDAVLLLGRRVAHGKRAVRRCGHADAVDVDGGFIVHVSNDGVYRNITFQLQCLIFSGIFFFLIIACEFFINYRIKFRSFKKKTDNDAIDSQASEETSSVTVENNDGEEVTA